MHRKVLENKQKAKTQKRSRSGSKSPQLSANSPTRVKRSRKTEGLNNDHTTRIAYQQGRQNVEMIVEASDQSGAEFLSEDDSSQDEGSDDDDQLSDDSEVQLRHSQSTELDFSFEVEGETADNNVEDVRPQPPTSQGSTEQNKKIKELDLEMKKRLLDLKEMMTHQGLTESVGVLESCFGVSATNGKRQGKGRRILKDVVNDNQNANLMQTNNSQSEVTIYQNAVPKRNSSSSEDGGILDSSDKLILNANVLSDMEHVPSRGNSRDVDNKQSRSLSAEEHTEQIIRQAEAAKAKIFPPTGRDDIGQLGQKFEFVAKIDQEYLSIGSHVDEGMRDRIQRGEYMDFAKLLPKDRITTVEDDGRMELIMRNGKFYWVPVTESVAINCFSKWEQAFRIYANIYTSKFPNKSSELIQYNHIIHSIASSYTWENVYSYDREFHIHLSKHPERSWSVILQQAWSMKLRDRISSGSSEYVTGGAGNHSNAQSGQNPGSSGPMPSKGKISEACKRYNGGRCKFGTTCRYKHKCLYCGKFRHTVLTCRKLMADKERQASANKDSSKSD